MKYVYVLLAGRQLSISFRQKVCKANVTCHQPFVVVGEGE